MAVQVRARRSHTHGAITTHVHQFGEETMFGFDVYYGPPPDLAEIQKLQTASRGTYPTIDAAKMAADAAAHGGNACGHTCRAWEDAE
jgi:hypothetical protein